MRQRADADRIYAFLRALGRAAKTDAQVYLTGGATAVLEDVGEMLARGLIEGNRLRELFAAIEPELYRFPAVDPASFRERVERFLREP